MAISKNTLSTNVWDVLYTYLQTTNPISTNNIFSAWNSTLSGTKGYPIVIITPPLCSINRVSANGAIIESKIVVNFEIYNTAAETVKSFKDSVVAKLLAGRITFTGDRLMNMELEDGDYDWWTEGDKKIHKIGFAASFRYVES